jgi:hypothetical protein
MAGTGGGAPCDRGQRLSDRGAKHWCLSDGAWMGSKEGENPTWVMERAMPSMSYGKSDANDGFSYRLPVGVDFLGEWTFTYLGLPLIMNKPTIQDCMPLVTRIERRLVKTSNFLTQGGKLQLVNSVLSYMATFYMCSIKDPIEVLNQIDKYRRHCL